MLYGRDAELAVVEGLLGHARQQRSGALVVRGEAGIGKSALLAHAAERADGLRVLRAAGVESEAEFAFAALHQLLWPLHNGIEKLPAPQAATLRGAFGLAPAPAEGHNRFLVAVAVLTLLADAAEQQPLLCLIDDAHWIDQSSVDALLFVTRRLAAEGIVVLFAARHGDAEIFAAPGVPELHLHGLDTEAATVLLADRNPDQLATHVIGGLVERTGGNPLALLEVPPLLEPAQRAGKAPLPEALPISERMERAFLARLCRLTPATRALLEVIAAEDNPELAVVLGAAAALGADADALEEAEASGLAHIVDDRIEFRHPLMRSAVYRAMTFTRRCAVHRTLADSLDGVALDRRAWHLAAATHGPDEAVAVALEDSAGRARGRSGHAAAATALHRAAELSDTTEAKARRLTLAANSAWLAGQQQRAEALVDRAALLANGYGERAAIAHLRGLFHLRGGAPTEAAEVLVDGAALVAARDPARALELLMVAADGATYAGDPQRFVDIAHRAADIPIPEDDRARFVACFLAGVAAVFQGDTPLAVERLHEADDLATTFDDPQYMLWASTAGLYTGRGDNRQLVRRAVARARELGAVGVLLHALEISALGMATAGLVTEAVTQASEGLQLARDTGQQASIGTLLAALATAAALQGRAQECQEYADEALAQAVPLRLGLAVGFANRALALLNLGLGRPAEALERFLAIASAGPGTGHPFVAMTCTHDLVESAVRAGRRDIAEQVVGDLAERAERADPGQRAILAYCQGLLGDTAEAMSHFEEALRLFTLPMPFWRARIELGYGEQLRRARRRSTARGHLRAALETFERLNITPWAERARTELRASGETARKRDPAAVNQLTPQELQIAGFAGRGASNGEIAAQLFLSRRTIEYHMAKVFQKLGVASRTELAALQLH